jgi:hypothetical protein
MLAPLLTLAAFVAFSYFARDVLGNPYWAMPEKMSDYIFVQGQFAALLSIPAAFAGLRLSTLLAGPIATWSRARWIAYRIAAAGSGIAGVVAALALR